MVRSRLWGLEGLLCTWIFEVFYLLFSYRTRRLLGLLVAKERDLLGFVGCIGLNIMRISAPSEWS